MHEYANPNDQRRYYDLARAKHTNLPMVISHSEEDTAVPNAQSDEEDDERITSKQRTALPKWLADSGFDDAPGFHYW